jgi:hypothetical protein
MNVEVFGLVSFTAGLGTVWIDLVKDIQDVTGDLSAFCLLFCIPLSGYFTGGSSGLDRSSEIVFATLTAFYVV